MTLPYPLLARGKIIDTDMWIFFDTATPKRGVQLSHDIESISCEDKAIKVYFKEDGFQQSFGIISQPSRARKLPILVSFPSKEAANAAFIGMAEQMAQHSGNWFIFPETKPKVARLYPKQNPPDPESKGPFTGGIGSDNRTYPLTNEHGKRLRVEYDDALNVIIFAYEDGQAVRCTFEDLPRAGK